MFFSSPSSSCNPNPFGEPVVHPRSVRVFLFGEAITAALENEDAPALRAAILVSAAHGPQKYGMEYFRYFFAQSLTKEHPLLGDLSVLFHEIESAWQPIGFGVNLVSATIYRGLSVAPDASDISIMPSRVMG